MIPHPIYILSNDTLTIWCSIIPRLQSHVALM